MPKHTTFDTKSLDLSSSMEEFIVGLIKETMETLMKEELTNVLQYEKYSYDGRATGNSRNGFYQRDYETRYGTIEDLNIPRDRNNEFEQQLIKPYARRDDWLENLIIRMYARGVSTREIASLIETLYGNAYSPTTISNITDVAVEEITKWHQRPLKRRYSVLFIDALHVKIRREYVASDAVYFILGVDEEGYREILDFFIGTNESAYVWEETLKSIKERGVEEVLLFAMDGLTGLDEAVHRVYPKADTQSCILHKVRSALRNVRKRDMTELAADIKLIYQASAKQEALDALDNLYGKWKKSYPRIVESWYQDEGLLTYFDYPESIRKSIYTTNWIERFNKEVRRLIKTKDSLPNEEACSKLIYYKVAHYNEKWSSKKLRGFDMAYDELQELFLRKYS